MPFVMPKSKGKGKKNNYKHGRVARKTILDAAEKELFEDMVIKPRVRTKRNG
jgi:hypothetical protein